MAEAGEEYIEKMIMMLYNGQQKSMAARIMYH